MLMTATVRSCFAESIFQASHTAFAAKKADVRAADIEICARNIEFEMLTPNGNKQINVSIPGLFNVFNAMLAASVCMKLGIDLDTIAKG